ncbi:MAG: hypothetical protein WKF58_03080 [Ilumatobacteraceae bacterium]
MIEPLVGEPSSLSLDELRRERSRLQAAEDAVSYARRAAQARLDLVQARLTDDEQPISAHLHEVLAHQLIAPSGRPRAKPTTMPSPTPPTSSTPSARPAASPVSTRSWATSCALAEALAQYERRVSAQRRELFESIDALSADLVRRYREGTADVDGLWERDADG